MDSSTLTDLPFDSSWCPVCSRQILPKRITVPVGAPATTQQQQLPPTTPAPPPSPTTSSKFFLSCYGFLSLIATRHRPYYLYHSHKGFKDPHSRWSCSRYRSRKAQWYHPENRATSSCFSTTTTTTPDTHPHHHRSESPSSLLLGRLPPS